MGKITKIKWPKGMTPDQWQQYRAEQEGIGTEITRIGGSDIGNVCFSTKYKCPRRLALHLVGIHSSFEITDTTLDGILQEPLLGAMFESWDTDEQVFRKQTQNGIKVREIKKAKFFLRNSDYPNLFVSIDFIPKNSEQYSPITGERYHLLTPIECKVTSKDYFRLWDFKGFRITEGYYAQVQAQMAVSGTDVAVFLVKLRETGKFIVQEIPRDQEFIDWMVDKINKFVEVVGVCKMWYLKYLFANTEEEKQIHLDMFENSLPPYGGSDDDVALADERWEPPIDPDAEYLSGGKAEEEMMSEYIRYGEVQKTCEEEKNKIKANLKHISSGFGGIKTTNFKAIIRGKKSDKKAYFSVTKIDN